MKLLISLFLMVLLITSPLLSVASEERDFSKYTGTHNEATTEKLTDEIYNYLKGINESKREANFTNQRNMTIDIFELIDGYGCSKELFVLNRGIQIKLREGKLTFIAIQIFLMNATGLIDTMMLTYDIDRVKKGEPMRKETDKIQAYK